MGRYKDKIITFPLFNTCYPQNLARNLARNCNQCRINIVLFCISESFSRVGLIPGILGIIGIPTNGQGQ